MSDFMGFVDSDMTAERKSSEETVLVTSVMS
jgi:hypothetical protein